MSSKCWAIAMTHCNRDILDFSKLGSRPVAADFQGGRLTTDAGALLLREVGDDIGLFDALDAAIPDPRHPFRSVYERPRNPQPSLAAGSG